MSEALGAQGDDSIDAALKSTDFNKLGLYKTCPEQDARFAARFAAPG